MPSVREMVQLMPVQTQNQLVADFESGQYFSPCVLYNFIVEYGESNPDQNITFLKNWQEIGKDFAFEVYRFHYRAFGGLPQEDTKSA